MDCIQNQKYKGAAAGGGRHFSVPWFDEFCPKKVSKVCSANGLQTSLVSHRKWKRRSKKFRCWCWKLLRLSARRSAIRSNYLPIRSLNYLWCEDLRRICQEFNWGIVIWHRWRKTLSRMFSESHKFVSKTFFNLLSRHQFSILKVRTTTRVPLQRVCASIRAA